MDKNRGRLIKCYISDKPTWRRGYHEKDTVLLPMGVCQTIDASYVKHAFWIVDYENCKDVSKG